MTTASQLVYAVAETTQSPDHDDAAILAILNRGLLEVAGGGDRAHGTVVIPPLPGLFTSDTITLGAGLPTVEMPTDFHRSLARVEYNGVPLKHYPSWRKFKDWFQRERGLPFGYCLVGSFLWVGPVQSAAVDLDVYYHRLPEEMEIVEADDGPPVVEAVDDEPDALPKHLHHKLLVNYAAKEIFSEIEQGLDGQSPDTMKYTALYHAALTDLERFIGPEDGEAQAVADEDYTDDMII